MAEYEIITEDISEEYNAIEVIDPALETEPEETVQVVEIEETEGFIFVDFEEDEYLTAGSESAFPSVGQTNERLKHSLLNGRDLPDQHPITSITGLRSELDSIEALQTVYSDKRQVADYYEWEDKNIYDENRIGYFVTVCEDANTIKICDGTNVFGVTVNEAAFIGGQEDVARGSDYGLVAHSGVVHIRCESDVTTDDYIISNRYGMAKKNEENYGFKVIGIEWVNGVKFAIVVLNLSVDQLDAIGEDINSFNSRLDDVETNILSAMNLANEAYNKSTVAINNSNTAIDTSNNVSSNFEDIILQVDDNERLVQEAVEAAVQAKTIADSAILTADVLRQEAVDAANVALAETIKMQDELTETKEQLQNDITNAELEIESAFENLNGLREDLEPLDSWTSENGTETGIVGFVARADEDSSTLASLTEWKGEAVNSIAGVTQTANDNKASLDILAGFEYGNNQTLHPYTNSPKDEEGNAISGSLDPISGITFSDDGNGVITATGTASGNADFIIAQNLALSEGKYSMSGCAENGSKTTYHIIVKQTKTDGSVLEFKDMGLYKDTKTEEYSKEECKFEIESGDIVSIWIRIATGTKVNNLQFKPCLKKYYMGISGLRNQVNKNGSSIDLLTSFSSETGSGVSGLIAKVSDHDATLSSIAQWQTNTTNAISATKKDVSDNYAKKTDVTALDTKTTNAIAATKSEAASTYAKQTDLTSFQNATNNSLASIERKADADGASIRLLVANMEKYSVGTYSPAYGFNSTQAKEVLEDGIVYVPTVAHTENTYTSSAYSFTIGYYYVWVKSTGTWTAYSNKVLFSGTLPSGTTYPYWYTNSSTVTSGYEPYTLYKLEIYTQGGVSLTRWVAVATLKGNSANRAISQIRQNANEISLAVTNANGSISGLTTKMGTVESSLSTVTSWKSNVESNVSKIATIESKANANATSISQVVSSVGSNGQVTSASIVTAINNSGSSITLNANKINFNGFTTFVRPSDLSTSGATTINSSNLTAIDGSKITSIDGSKITTGLIKSANYVYNSAGTAINLSNGVIDTKNFKVDGYGNVTASNANITGTITATSGSIAGFNIGKSNIYSNALYKAVTTDDGTQYEAGMKGGSSATDLAFYVRKSTDNWASNNYTFYIRYNGQLYAEAGKIGGWIIDGTQLKTGQASTTNAFYISSYDNAAANWIKAYNDNGNVTFRVGKDGCLYATNATITGKISASSGNFANGVTIGGSSITAGDLRKLYRAARLGYNDSDSLQILRIDATSGKVGNWNITSAHLYCSSDTSQVFLDSTYLKVYTSSTWYNATWKQVAVAGKNSDARLKHNILNVESKYEELFNCLQPKTFGYTEKAQSGDPNHIHFGFIAQDILATEKQLNLDNLSFVFDNEGYYGLKMDEFIALNTWQIQKAKTRISELEEKVAKLEKLINDK